MLKWFEEVESNNPNIVCSRIRLMRNWNEYAFPIKLSEHESDEMVQRLEQSLKNVGEIDNQSYEYAHLNLLKELDRKVLRERKVINESIVSKKSATGILVSEREDTSLIFNGDDHIRIQLFERGYHLEKLWEKANKIDDYVNTKIPYAFDRKYGYLTSFPTNVGTGLRASVFIHLPALSTGKKFSSITADMSRFGISIKGLYGEGRENYGSLYEISNQKTLGQTEREIIDLVNKAAYQISNQEYQIRMQAIEKHRLEREDEVYKSYGVLRYAKRLAIKDAMTFLSELMAGVSDGLIKLKEPCSIFRLMLGVQVANLQKLSETPLNKEELEVARAKYLRLELPAINE